MNTEKKKETSNAVRTIGLLFVIVVTLVALVFVSTDQNSEQGGSSSIRPANEISNTNSNSTDNQSLENQNTLGTTVVPNNLTCSIEESSDEFDTRKQFRLEGLNTNSPHLITVTAGVVGDFPLIKDIDNEKGIGLSFKAPGTGSGDAIAVFRDTLRFERAESTNIGNFTSSGQCS